MNPTNSNKRCICCSICLNEISFCLNNLPAVFFNKLTVSIAPTKVTLDHYLCLNCHNKIKKDEEDLPITPKSVCFVCGRAMTIAVTKNISKKCQERHRLEEHVFPHLIPYFTKCCRICFDAVKDSTDNKITEMQTETRNDIEESDDSSENELIINTEPSIADIKDFEIANVDPIQLKDCDENVHLIGKETLTTDEDITTINKDTVNMSVDNEEKSVNNKETIDSDPNIETDGAIINVKKEPDTDDEEFIIESDNNCNLNESRISDVAVKKEFKDNTTTVRLDDHIVVSTLQPPPLARLSSNIEKSKSAINGVVMKPSKPTIDEESNNDVDINGISEDETDFDSEESEEGDDGENGIDPKLLMVPVVYSKKLDNLKIFRHKKYSHVRDKLIIQNALAENKPPPKKIEKLNESVVDTGNITDDLDKTSEPESTSPDNEKNKVGKVLKIIKTKESLDNLLKGKLAKKIYIMSNNKIVTSPPDDLHTKQDLVNNITPVRAFTTKQVLPNGNGVPPLKQFDKKQDVANKNVITPLKGFTMKPVLPNKNDMQHQVLDKKQEKANINVISPVKVFTKRRVLPKTNGVSSPTVSDNSEDLEIKNVIPPSKVYGVKQQLNKPKPKPVCNSNSVVYSSVPDNDKNIESKQNCNNSLISDMLSKNKNLVIKPTPKECNKSTDSSILVKQIGSTSITKVQKVQNIGSTSITKVQNTNQIKTCTSKTIVNNSNSTSVNNNTTKTNVSNSTSTSVNNSTTKTSVNNSTTKTNVNNSTSKTNVNNSTTKTNVNNSTSKTNLNLPNLSIKKTNQNITPTSKCHNQDTSKLTINHWMFKKPRIKKYNPRSLRKNPDFNSHLKHLDVGFFEHEDNIKYLDMCIPVTIDLNKEFESKLEGNTLYLDKIPDTPAPVTKSSLIITKKANNSKEPQTKQNEESCCWCSDKMKNDNTLRKHLCDRICSCCCKQKYVEILRSKRAQQTNTKSDKCSDKEKIKFPSGLNFTKTNSNDLALAVREEVDLDSTQLLHLKSVIGSIQNKFGLPKQDIQKANETKGPDKPVGKIEISLADNNRPVVKVSKVVRNNLLPENANKNSRSLLRSNDISGGQTITKTSLSPTSSIPVPPLVKILPKSILKVNNLKPTLTSLPNAKETGRRIIRLTSPLSAPHKNIILKRIEKSCLKPNEKVIKLIRINRAGDVIQKETNLKQNVAPPKIGIRKLNLDLGLDDDEEPSIKKIKTEVVDISDDEESHPEALAITNVKTEIKKEVDVPDSSKKEDCILGI